MARMQLILTAAVLLTASLSPDHARADDREIAQQIANVMKATGKLKDYDIMVTYSDREAKLQGTVASRQQMETAIEITTASPHVDDVVNKLSIVAPATNPVEIRPAAPLNRPVRISPVAAKQKPAAASSTSTANTPTAGPQVVSASLSGRSAGAPVAREATVTPPLAVNSPVLTASAPRPQSSRRVPTQSPAAFSRPVPMAASTLSTPSPTPPARPMMDPRMAGAGMARMDPRMAGAGMDPRMARMDPRMAQMLPPAQAMTAPTMPPVPERAGHERSAMAALAAPLAAVAAPFAALSAGGSAQPAQPGRPQPAFVPGTGGGVAPVGYDQPQLPAYAWPSYAPYPNYAALTYPKQYSPTAWPYIGPFYPYPQVPLGWRKVTLEWDDGWWFLDFKDK
ncbi:MAG: BON domain-containing protein [Planctomycetota bacterium]|nr:BON domain-containing protein [Planctomycetota bacterium]